MSLLSTATRFGLVATLAAAVVGGSSCSGRDEPVETGPEAQAPIEYETPSVVASPAPEAEVIGADGPARILADIPFEYSWDLQLPTGVHTSWYSPNVPDLLFMQLKNGQIHALDAKSGETRWVTRRLPRLMEHPAYVARTRIPSGRTGEFINDDRLYVISDDVLFCFDAIYGQLIWRCHLGRTGPKGFLPSSGPLAMGDAGNLKVFIGDWEGRIQVIGFDEESSTPFHEWQWNLYSVPTAQPVGAEDLSYVADHDGKLHCFGLERELRWSFDSLSQLMTAPYLRGSSLYLGSRSNVLHILNRLSGVEVAKVFLGAPVTASPFGFNGEGDRIYTFTGHGDASTLHAIRTLPDEVPYEDVDKFALEIERVAVTWSVADVDRLVSSTPNQLFVTRAANPNRILAVNRESGAVDWHWDINGDRAGGEGRYGRGGPVAHMTEYQDPSDDVRSIFTVDDNGYVVAYRLFGQF
jgi:outer membrane protein assembly factor BamB